MSNKNDHLRARPGQYVKQPSGYKAFIPAPLSSQLPLRMDDRLLELLSEADRDLGRLDGSIHVLPAVEQFVFMYKNKEAVLSSRIEGTQSSLNDLLAANANLYEGLPKDVIEVVNHVKAMNAGLQRLETIPVSIRLIMEIHAILLKEVRGGQYSPGELRQHQNWIGPAGSSIENATFVPPPPQEVGRVLSDWEKFLHDEHPMPYLIKVGLAHAQFETIHPFLDGNGRIGRLLITFLLCQQGILQKPVLYISHYFMQHRQEYYDKLQAFRDKGGWEGWLAFFLKAVSTVARDAADTARKIIKLREQHHQLIGDRFGRTAGNGIKLLNQLYMGPTTSVQKTAALMSTSRQTAHLLIQKFVSEGLLTEITGWKRNQCFRYDPYVALFREDDSFLHPL